LSFTDKSTMPDYRYLFMQSTVQLLWCLGSIESIPESKFS